MHYGGDGRTSKSIYAKEPLLTAETRLWRGVLEQAYADAELPLGVESEDELFIEQIRARRFLRADTPGERKNCGSCAITPKFLSIAWCLGRGNTTRRWRGMTWRKLKQRTQERLRKS